MFVLDVHQRKCYICYTYIHMNHLIYNIMDISKLVKISNSTTKNCDHCVVCGSWLSEVPVDVVLNQLDMFHFLCRMQYRSLHLHQSTAHQHYWLCSG